jgi:hypothetical protein
MRHVPIRIRPALAVLVTLALAAAAPVAAASGLLAFTRATSLRQGAFEAAGIAWSCNAELCTAQGPDDVALWPGLCAAFAREAGEVAAFGSLTSRFDAAALALCNATAAAGRAAVAVAAPAVAAMPPDAERPSAPEAAVAPDGSAAPPAPARPRELGGAELCNGVDDDGDGQVDEGVLLTVWADGDQDLFGDPARAREICPQELRPGLVVNDYDCDDGDARRNPARDNCG